MRYTRPSPPTMSILFPAVPASISRTRNNSSRKGSHNFAPTGCNKDRGSFGRGAGPGGAGSAPGRGTGGPRPGAMSILTRRRHGPWRHHVSMPPSIGASLRRPQRSPQGYASFSESSNCAKSHTGGFWGAVHPLLIPVTCQLSGLATQPQESYRRGACNHSTRESACSASKLRVCPRIILSSRKEE